MKNEKKINVRVWTGTSGLSMVTGDGSWIADESLRHWLAINGILFDRTSFGHFIVFKPIKEDLLIQLANDYNVKYEKNWWREKKKEK